MSFYNRFCNGQTHAGALHTQAFLASPIKTFEDQRQFEPVDAGSAVTVDLVDATGAFRGGVTFPGPRPVAPSLPYHTSLPLAGAVYLLYIRIHAVRHRTAAPPDGTGTGVNSPPAGFKCKLVSALCKRYVAGK